ncbi:MAG: ribosome recycling factor [Clostridia bacterium]
MDFSEIENKMKKAIEHLKYELENIRAGRANPAILNKVFVDYYGVPTPITQVGTISVPQARQILVNPWDKSMLVAIEKAIQKAALGVNPLNDGSSIRITFPELNEERRKALTKDVKTIGEEIKIAIRNIRREFIDIAKLAQKSNEITEDDLEISVERIQKITDKYILIIDELINSKEKEIMEI